MAEEIRVFNVDEEGRFGGPERRVTLVAAEILSMGIDTTVVLPGLDSLYFKSYLCDKKVNYLIIDITRLSLEPKILVRYLLRFLPEILLLYRVFTKNNPDIVHVNGASQFKVAVAAKLARRLVVWHLNNTLLKTPVKFVFDLVSYFCADAVIYAGSRAGGFYKVKERFSGIPCANIEAPVSDEFFFIPIKKTLYRRIEIVCVGGINAAKGIDDVVLVAAECYRRGIKFRICIAGKILPSQNDYFKTVQNLIDEHNVPPTVLEFLGEVKNVPALLSEADIALTMSHREASPVAVWEGLAAGRIVITTDVGSVSDHIEHGKNGFIVRIGEIKSVVSIIEGIYRNTIDLTGVRESARMIAKDRFNVRAISEQHKWIYKQVVGRG